MMIQHVKTEIKANNNQLTYTRLKYNRTTEQTETNHLRNYQLYQGR